MNTPTKNLLPNLSLFFIPLGFLLLSLYNLSIQGPFYSAGNIDPSYAYLFNGFELLHFHAPGHVDHPGTTTQIFMALVMGLKWLFTAVSCWMFQQPIPSLDHLFYTQADAFLYTSAIALILFNTLLFSWTSIKLFLYAKKQHVIFAFQLSLFLFFPAIETFSMFTPEPMLLSGVLLLCLALFPVLIQDQNNKNNINHSKYAGYFGLALGFGLATKVTFLPLGLLLFLYPKNQYKKILKYTLISFLLCTFPIWGRYLNMLKWLFNLATHQGGYGTGAVGLIDTTKIITNFQLILTNAPFILVTLVGITSYLVLTYKKNSPIIKKFLILSIGAILFALALNLKHPGIRYMIPVLLLCAPVVAIITYQLDLRLNLKKNIYTTAVFAILLPGLGFSAVQYQQWHQAKILETKGRAAFQEYVKANQCKVIGYYHPSMQSYALYFGNQWAGKKRTQKLDNYYPNSLFFEPERERFFDFHGPNHYVLNTQEVEQKLKQYACVVFQGSNHFSLSPNSPYQNRIIEKSLDGNKSMAARFYVINIT